MMALRIALVAPFGLRAKGTARARALPLGRALVRRGHTVALFVPPYDSPEDAGRCWTEAGVEVVNLALPAVGRGGAVWHLWLGWRLFLAVRRWGPDVVHIFKPKGPSGLAGMMFWVTRGRGETGTRGDGDAGTRGRGDVETRGCGDAETRRRGDSDPLSFSSSPNPRIIVDADDWEGPGGWNDDSRTGYSAAQRRFFAWQERYGLSHADAWTVTSHCLRDRAISFGASPEHVHILHNGVPESSIFHLPSSIFHPPSAVLYTRFAGVQPAEVVEIWGQVRALRPDATLTVLGRGVAGEERVLVGVPGLVVRGWVEPAELPAILGSARLGIVPWADTPSNRARHSAKVLELMAASLPIVAYAVGELPFTLGDAGLLIPAGDREAFVRAVILLLDDPARAKALGAAAQARARTAFNWDVLAERALEAYGAV